jgi:F-type H+-transporting ATPase subunit delta
MRDSTIARNYADALLALAAKNGDRTGWGVLISQLADAMASNRTLRQFLETPQVSGAEKSAVLEKALGNKVPRHFVLFLVWLVKNRRQMLVPEIAVQYHSILDEVEGRVHARVTVARATGSEGDNWIAEQLSRVFGKQGIPHVSVDPSILGGVVVRVGDTVMDGSVARRLATLRARLA